MYGEGEFRQNFFFEFRKVSRPAKVTFFRFQLWQRLTFCLVRSQIDFVGAHWKNSLLVDTFLQCETALGGTICESRKDNCKNTESSSLGYCNVFKAKSTSGESLEVIYTSRPTLYATFGMGEPLCGGKPEQSHTRYLTILCMGTDGFSGLLADSKY